MCDIGKALSRAFSPPGTGKLLNDLEGQRAAADRSTDTAEQALQDALAKMRDASMPALDNPFALANAKSQMLRLMSMRGGAASFTNTPTAAPATATKILMGS